MRFFGKKNKQDNAADAKAHLHQQPVAGQDGALKISHSPNGVADSHPSGGTAVFGTPQASSEANSIPTKDLLPPNVYGAEAHTAGADKVGAMNHLKALENEQQNSMSPGSTGVNLTSAQENKLGSEIATAQKNIGIYTSEQNKYNDLKGQAKAAGIQPTTTTQPTGGAGLSKPSGGSGTSQTHPSGGAGLSPPTGGAPVGPPGSPIPNPQPTPSVPTPSQPNGAAIAAQDVAKAVQEEQAAAAANAQVQQDENLDTFYGGLAQQAGGNKVGALNYLNAAEAAKEQFEKDGVSANSKQIQDLQAQENTAFANAVGDQLQQDHYNNLKAGVENDEAAQKIAAKMDLDAAQADRAAAAAALAPSTSSYPPSMQSSVTGGGSLSSNQAPTGGAAPVPSGPEQVAQAEIASAGETKK